MFTIVYLVLNEQFILHTLKKKTQFLHGVLNTYFYFIELVYTWIYWRKILRTSKSNIFCTVLDQFTFWNNQYCTNHQNSLRYLLLGVRGLWVWRRRSPSPTFIGRILFIWRSTRTARDMDQPEPWSIKSLTFSSKSWITLFNILLKLLLLLMV